MRVAAADYDLLLRKQDKFVSFKSEHTCPSAALHLQQPGWTGKAPPQQCQMQQSHRPDGTNHPKLIHPMQIYMYRIGALPDPSLPSAAANGSSTYHARQDRSAANTKG